MELDEEWEKYANDNYEDRLRMFSFSLTAEYDNYRHCRTQRMYHWKSWVEYEYERTYEQVIEDHKKDRLILKGWGGRYELQQVID